MKKACFQTILQLLLMVLFTSVACADYGLMLSSHKNKESAVKYTKSLMKQNKNVIVQKVQIPGRGFWYRTCIGPFTTKGDALKQRKDLQSSGFKGDIIVVKINKKNTVFQKSTVTAQTRRYQYPVAAKPAPRSPKAHVTLEWDASKESDLAGYKIYYDTDSKLPYNPAESDWADEGPPPIIVGSNVTKITLHGLTDTKKYFFSITSFNTRGIESSHSTEVTIPPKTAPLIFHPHETVIVTADSLNMRSGPGTNTKSLKKLEKGTKVKVIKRLKKWVKVLHDGQTGYISKQYVHTLEEREKGIEGKKLILSDIAAGSTDITTDESAEPKTQQTQQTQPEESLLIYAGDILKIEVPGQKQMSYNYDVDPKGNIYMLMIGKVRAQGLSEFSLSEKLTKALKKYMGKEDKALARIVKRERYIYIQGGVRYPGWYRVSCQTTLDDIIKTAGGLLSNSVYSKISLKRMTEDGYKRIIIKNKIFLSPNDVFVIPFPKEYRKEADKGDLLFISIPQRQAPGRRPATTDSADLRQSLIQNQIEIDRNGYIYLPNYGHIYVNKLTTEEIKKEITKRLPKYIAVLSKVEVSIIEKKHYVQLLGHITNPGWYNVPETANIQEAINAAGGAIDGATMSDITIHRKVDEVLKRIKVNLYQYTITGDPVLLTPIHENDTVFIPISSNFGNIKRTLMAWSPPTERLEEDVKAKVRIFGAVRNTGIYELEEGMNLIDLLVLASGENEWAELTDILIIRNNKIEVRYDLEEFLSGEKGGGGIKPPPKLQSGDTVYVTRIETTTKEAQDRIYMLGSVRAPGSYELWDDETVLQALAWAGGLTEWADSSNIMIIRMVDGKQENIPYNYEKGVRGRFPEINIRLQPNDTIVIP